MKTEHVQEFERALPGWTDERFVSRQDLRTMAMYTLYLVNLLEDVDVQYDGYSLRVGTPMCLLVVRGTVGGIPHVVFTSGRTTIACMRIFLRKLEEDLLEWTVDRFR